MAKSFGIVGVTATTLIIGVLWMANAIEMSIMDFFAVDIIASLVVGGICAIIGAHMQSKM